jgi:two-component sensor histidine kinase
VTSTVNGGRLVLRLPDDRVAAEMARQGVGLVGFSIPIELRENAQLVVTELVSNGLEHGVGGVTLSLAVSELGRLTGEVIDEGGGFDPPPPREESATRGWGLTIVAALVERWGVEKNATRVWFAMPRGLA